MKSELFDALIDKSEELLIITDSNFVCIFTTSFLLDYFDIKKSKIINQNMFSIFSDPYTPNELIDISKSIKFLSTQLNISRHDHQYSIRIENLQINNKQYYFFHIYRPNIVKDDQLKFLSQSTIDLMNMETPNDIYTYIAEKSQFLTENCITASFKYDSITDRIEMVHLSGISKGMTTLFTLLGRNPIGMQFPVSEQGRKVLKTGNLMRGPDDLFTLSSKWLPEFISKKINKAFKLTSIYLLGISRNNKIIGELIVFVKKGGNIQHPSLLESFVQNAGMILDRKNTENRLKEAEQRYQTLFNDSQLVNLIIDSNNLKILEVNDAACEFYGYSREEFKDLYIYDLSLNSIEKIQKDVEDAKESLNKYFIFRHTTKSGEIREVEINTSVIDISGNSFIFSQIKDITDIINVKNRLERGEQITKIGNWELDLNSLKVYASNGAKKIYGFNKKDVNYSDIMNIPLPEYREKLDNSFQDLVKHDLPYDLEFKIKTVDKGIIKDIRSLAYFDKEKNTIYGAIQDITDIVKINKELKEAKESAEESDRLKSSFLANLSHEIRTPMNAIKGFAEILKEPNLSQDEMQEYINIININSEQLMSIINDVLDISKIESGVEKFNYESINLKTFFTTFAKSYELRCNMKGLDFILTHSEEECNIIADKARLTQVCDNLFGNAVKFTHKGFIEIEYKLDGDKTIIFFKDTGIGIPDDKLERIFERFYQIEENYRGENTGTGLGLAITKTIIEQMKGEIKVVSELEKGSIFEIIFNSHKNMGNINIPADYGINTAQNKLNNKKILVAEEFKSNYDIFEKFLTKYHCKAVWAKNGPEAFKMAKENAFDLIIMNIKLPEIDGITSASMIHSIKPDLPVIAHTTNATLEDKDKIRQSKCVDMILKPVTEQELISLITKYI